MKTIFVLIYFIAFPLMPTSSSSHGAELEPWSAIEIQENVIFPFFVALKNGDIDEIRSYFSETMYYENRRLLEENTEYPDFLRSYYQGANLRVLKTSEVDGEVECDVLIEFPNGSQSISKLRVSQETNGEGTMPKTKGWKISSMESNR